MSPREQLNSREIKVATLVWQGRTNPEIAATLGTSEQVVKNQLRSVFDKLGVWSRLELALYIASNGGVGWADDLQSDDLQSDDLQSNDTDLRSGPNPSVAAAS